MNINRYGRTYRNGILVAKFRVSYVKIRYLYPKEYWETPIWPTSSSLAYLQAEICAGLRESDLQN